GPTSSLPYTTLFRSLLSGDHALVLTSGGPVAGGVAGPGGYPQPAYGPRLLLIDLAGHPSVMSSYTIDGRLIDARQIGPAVRVVRSEEHTSELQSRSD